MICTPIVLKFCFGVKMWGACIRVFVKGIDWSDEAFNSLVLGSMLIHSLFKSHTAHAAMFDDIVNGLIEMTRRPFYSVSAGELGTEPKELDERLPLILEIAQTWDAVLLLDEAEVFLQQRSTTDVTRNALVSILLGQLEYYQGILILTTNLIEQCDPRRFFDPLPGSWLRLTNRSG
ncbi:hypothetical protein B0H13DRAFT_2228733 [Mycena leptocephala]|nr:hypothetical protein B0H13DRAFT_2228733 [Mycena leptocephala]